MKYILTKDLETGNALIDSEHKQLFTALNNLMDACSQGKGRDQIQATLNFLTDYVRKHFADEEQLQKQTNYPGFTAHKQFHESYKVSLGQAANAISTSGATIATLSQLNQKAAVLVNHIRTEDKKLAAHVQASR